MNILCVCGMGIGTSVLLKMNTEKALRNLGIDGQVTTADISSARGAAQGADLILTSAELVSELGTVKPPVEVVRNFMDANEIQSVLAKHQKA